MKNFGNRIKALRRKMNLTQEELAERLNVSFQTISKWETNASLPDVSMFPLLANFFNVTTDELMGVDLAKKQAKIDEIIGEYNHLSNLGKEKERFDFICQAYREYPNDYKILEKYIVALYYDPYFWEEYWKKKDNGELPEDFEKVAHKEELLVICKRILNECLDEEIRYTAISLLSGIYCNTGNEEKAIEYIELLPFKMQGEEKEELYVRGTEKWWEYVRGNIYDISENLYVKIRNCGLHAETNTESIRILNKAVDFIKLIYDEGDYGFSHYNLAELYYWLSGRYSYEKDYENCAKNLELCLYHAKAYDELPKTTIHSSYLVRGFKFERSKVYSGYECNDVKRELYHIQNDKLYDNVRDKQWFIDIIEKYTPFAKDSK